MLAKVAAPASVGFGGTLVEVGCDITNDLPLFVVVGLGNKAVDEARDRVRTAIQTLNLSVRAYMRTIKVARTIADLEGSAHIKSTHISQAVRYRSVT